MYIVHTIADGKKRSFRLHKPAFQAFKIAARRNMVVALWHQSEKGKWTLVHRAGFYPDLTEPLYDSYNIGAA